MNNTPSFAPKVCSRLLLSGAVLPLFLASAALAQTAPAASTGTETVVVTGSLIARPDYNTATPTVSATTADLQAQRPDRAGAGTYGIAPILRPDSRRGTLHRRQRRSQSGPALSGPAAQPGAAGRAPPSALRRGRHRGLEPAARRASSAASISSPAALPRFMARTRSPAW